MAPKGAFKLSVELLHGQFKFTFLYIQIYNYSKLLVQLFLDLKDYDCEKSQNCVQNVLKSSRLEILKKCTKQWSETNLIGMAFKKCYPQRNIMRICSLFSQIQLLSWSMLPRAMQWKLCIFSQIPEIFSTKDLPRYKKVGFSLNKYLSAKIMYFFQAE